MPDHRRRRVQRKRLAAACVWLGLVAGCGGGGDDAPPVVDATAPPSTQTSLAVAFQADASHSGIASASTPTFPLTPAWQRTFAATVSYPLIAQGKVYVIVSDAFNGPLQLIAIDQFSGLDEWRAPIGTAFNASHAYDGGRVFVAGSDNILRAFDARTGTQAWSTLLLSFSQGGTPVARDGKVYVSSGSLIHAVDGRSGAILWTVGTSSFAPVSLSATGVLFSLSCAGAVSLEQSTGAQIWRVAPDPTCFSSPGSVAQAAGRAYIRDFDITSLRATLVVRDALTGTLGGTAGILASSLPIPAVADNAVYVSNAGTLQRLDASLQSVAWSFAGDGTLTSAPLVVGGVVMIGGYAGRLYAVDAVTGAERWSTLVPSGIDQPQETLSVTTGMAAANGILVVPNGRNLSTWRLSAP